MHAREYIPRDDVLLDRGARVVAHTDAGAVVIHKSILLNRGLSTFQQQDSVCLISSNGIFLNGGLRATRKIDTSGGVLCDGVVHECSLRSMEHGYSELRIAGDGVVLNRGMAIIAQDNATSFLLISRRFVLRDAIVGDDHIRGVLREDPGVAVTKNRVVFDRRCRALIEGNARQVAVIGDRALPDRRFAVRCQRDRSTVVGESTLLDGVGA